MIESEWVTEVIEKATVQFSKWRGGRVKLWDFSPTLMTLTLRVESGLIPGNLHIVCGGCRYIKGPFSWRECSFEIKRPASQGEGLDLIDSTANFALQCRVVGVQENVEPVYKTDQDR